MAAALPAPSGREARRSEPRPRPFRPRPRPGMRLVGSAGSEAAHPGRANAEEGGRGEGRVLLGTLCSQTLDLEGLAGRRDPARARPGFDALELAGEVAGPGRGAVMLGASKPSWP